MPAQLPPFRQRLTTSEKNPPFAEAYVCSAEITERVSPMACASFADTRARKRLGIAIAAMMPMMATTMRSSIRVKPRLVRMFFLQRHVPKILNTHVARRREGRTRERFRRQRKP